jgi:hypothetical protein
MDRITDWVILSSTQRYGTSQDDTGWTPKYFWRSSEPNATAAIPADGRASWTPAPDSPSASQGFYLDIQWRRTPRRSGRAGSVTPRFASPLTGRTPTAELRSRWRTAADNREQQRPSTSINPHQYQLSITSNPANKIQRTPLPTVTAILYNSALRTERTTPLHRGCGKGAGNA